MKFQNLFMFGCLVLFGACARTNPVAETVFVDIEPKKTTPDSVILTDREIILLETHPQALLSKINALDIHQDKLYILDQRREKILVFDRNGNFISAIGRRGRGPGEYTNVIIDFCIDRENNEILIATDRPNRIMFFSLSGKFIEETLVDDLLFEIVKSDNKIYAHLMRSDKYEFIVYELEGRAITSVKYPEIPLLKRNYNEGEIIVPFGRMLNASKQGILFTRTFDNTIYKVEENKLIPFRTIDFGNYYLEDVRTFTKQEILGLARRNIIYSITNARLIGEDEMIFNGYPNGIFVVNGDTGRHYGGLSNELSIFEHTDIVPVLDPQGDYIAFSHSASKFADFYNWVERDPRGEFTEEMFRLSGLKQDDNPVIFLYRLKGASD